MPHFDSANRFCASDAQRVLPYSFTTRCQSLRASSGCFSANCTSAALHSAAAVQSG